MLFANEEEALALSGRRGRRRGAWIACRSDFDEVVVTLGEHGARCACRRRRLRSVASIERLRRSIRPGRATPPPGRISRVRLNDGSVDEALGAAMTAASHRRSGSWLARVSRRSRAAEPRGRRGKVAGRERCRKSARTAPGRRLFQRARIRPAHWAFADQRAVTFLVMLTLGKTSIASTASKEPSTTSKGECNEFNWKRPRGAYHHLGHCRLSAVNGTCNRCV